MYSTVLHFTVSQNILNIFILLELHSRDIEIHVTTTQKCPSEWAVKPEHAQNS